MEWVIWNGLFGIDYWDGLLEWGNRNGLVRQSLGEVG